MGGGIQPHSAFSDVSQEQSQAYPELKVAAAAGNPRHQKRLPRTAYCPALKGMPGQQ